MIGISFFLFMSVVIVAIGFVSLLTMAAVVFAYMMYQGYSVEDFIESIRGQ